MVPLRFFRQIFFVAFCSCILHPSYIYLSRRHKWRVSLGWRRLLLLLLPNEENKHSHSHTHSTKLSRKCELYKQKVPFNFETILCVSVFSVSVMLELYLFCRWCLSVLLPGDSREEGVCIIHFGSVCIGKFCRSIVSCVNLLLVGFF